MLHKSESARIIAIMQSRYSYPIHAYHKLKYVCKS